MIKGECGGGLWVRTDGGSGPSYQQGLLTLAAQVGLALESVALTEDLLERESERRFRRLVQNSTDLIVVLEPDLTIRFATPSARSVLGFQSEELVGTSLVALLRPDEAGDGRRPRRSASPVRPSSTSSSSDGRTAAGVRSRASGATSATTPR